VHRGGKNTSAPEIWAAGRRVERSQCDLRYGRDECNRVAGGSADVVHAVPRAGTGRLGTKGVSDTAIHPDWSCGGRVLFAPIRFIFAENSFSLISAVHCDGINASAQVATRPITPRNIYYFIVWASGASSVSVQQAHCSPNWCLCPKVLFCGV
jgi:hypothetical protein